MEELLQVLCDFQHHGEQHRSVPAPGTATVLGTELKVNRVYFSHKKRMPEGFTGHMFEMRGVYQDWDPTKKRFLKKQRW